MKLSLFYFFLLYVSVIETLHFDSKIIIIGAGPSGIAAGTKLLENGFKNIKILEAENRIGGRVNTIPFGDGHVEMGAQWCHGEEGNVIFEIASPLGLLENSTQTNFSMVRSNGDLLDHQTIDKLMQLADEIIEKHEEEINRFNGSLGEFVERKFRELVTADEYKDISSTITEKFLSFFLKYQSAYEGSDTLYDMSAKSYSKYHEAEGNLLWNWKRKGYKIFLDVMMKKFPDPSQDLNLEEKIQLNKTVTNIDWSGDAVKVICNDEDFTGDHVISTVSLGVLKHNHQSLFTPSLPPAKQNSIEGLGFGTVDKVFLEFSEPFWKPDWYGFNVFWDAADLEEIRKSEDNWIEDMIGIFTVDYQPNVLCGWIHGVRARQMERLSSEQVLRSVMNLIRKLLKTEVSEPIRFLRTTWYTNPNFRGSYSYLSMTTDRLNASAADLANPLLGDSGKPKVLFAGEATSDHHFSTVQGAVESGWREAKRIIDYHGRV